MTKIVSTLILIAAMLTTLSCAETSPSDRTVCPSKSADDYYFAKGAIDQADKRTDKFVRHWYSKQLAAMNEPSISCGEPGKVYRFTWLRTFHHPVVVRVTNEGNHATLQAIELDGAGGYEPGKVLRRAERTLSTQELRELKSALSEAQLGAMSTSEDSPGKDGAEWIIEASNKGAYHLVARWSPEKGPIREIGSRFLALTGWKFGEVY